MVRLGRDEWETLARKVGLEPDVRADGPAPVETVEGVEGVIDLAFREPDGWVLLDWKTDATGEDGVQTLVSRYRPQVDLYAECWARLTGAPVKERGLVFLSASESVVW